MCQRDGFLWLEKGRFYIFSTYEYIRVPSDFAVEMMAFDTTSGEFRAHYAGFFDPGFGHGEDGEVKGTPAVLEVRAYEDDLVVRHRQPIARMVRRCCLSSFLKPVLMSILYMLSISFSFLPRQLFYSSLDYHTR